MNTEHALTMLATTHNSEIARVGDSADYAIEREGAVCAVAEALYSELYGHLDDKRQRAVHMTELFIWIESGTITLNTTITTLVAEWQQREADATIATIG